MMHQENLKKIVSRHVQEVDKYYRMFAGLSSELMACTNDALYINVCTDSRWKKDHETTARQLAVCWRRHNPELHQARYYLVNMIDVAGLHTTTDLPHPDKALRNAEHGVAVFGCFND
jgi:hypothetical protein